MKKMIVTATFAAKSDFLYRVFVDSKLQTEILGSPAKINNKVGGSFSAWDGYITGKTIKLVKDKCIVQNWRTTDFSEQDKDSTVKIELTALGPKKTKLVLTHTGLPVGTEAEYKKGWQDYYFKPIKEYLEKNKE